MKNKQEKSIISGKKHFIIDVSANSVAVFIIFCLDKPMVI
jgi:hypothetical protein